MSVIELCYDLSLVVQMDLCKQIVC